MAKRQTIDLPGQIHFVTFSTYQRRQFLAPERTRCIVLEAVQTCLETHHALCHGYVVMPNHVHALLTVEPGKTLASFLQPWKKTSSYRIKRFYAQELTKYHERCPEECPIWQASYYDYPVEMGAKTNEKLAYMHNNPVEAGLVRQPLDWKWSSARFYADGRSAGVTITPLG